MLPLIDVTMTATLRPEVLKITLDSFFDNAFDEWLTDGGGLRFIVNVDPVGRPPYLIPHTIEQTIKTIYETIPDSARSGVSVCVNTPKTANFAKAFKWCWSEVSAPLVFHLEDDWQLLKPASLRKMMDVMVAEPDLASLRLSFFTADEDRLKNWNRFFPYKEQGYFDCPRDLIQSCGFCGHPALIRGDFVKEAAPLLDVQWNPEKQFHHWNRPLIAHALRWRYGVFADPGSKPVLKDLGRQWLKENGIKKKGIKAFFTEWESEDV